MIAESARVDPLEVKNQPPPLEDYDLFATDAALSEALAREAGPGHENRVRPVGTLAGSAEVQRLGRLANEHPPQLRTHDRFGHRIDEVEFHPAWHELMRTAMSLGLHCLPWSRPGRGANVARAAQYYQLFQMEQGTACPITMTFAAIPVLRRHSALPPEWLSKLLSHQYDPRFVPAGEKTSLLIGMGMTEKQGGSDVRANTTEARSVTDGYELTGHKWFMSAPMCDAFLVLAQAARGLSCFLVPRWRPDGGVNAIRIQRLKDKLGNRSNASSEVEFHQAWGRRIGEEGRGVSVIIEMVHHTRLDCAIGSAALLRQALVQALHHSTHRRAFGERLIAQPLMQNVLADLCLESEAALVLAMRLARAFDGRDESEAEARLSRIATGIAKYWICKRAPTAVFESMECLGGNGYVEESILPRLYREAPLNSIWEGSGNVNALDLLRAIRNEPQTLEALLDEIRLASGSNKHLDRFAHELEQRPEDLADPGQARRRVERLALALQASLLVRFAPEPVSDAFCLSRLARDWGTCLGTLPAGVPFPAILARAWPG